MTNRRGFFAMAQKIRPNLATMTGVELLGILVDLVALLYYLWERSAEKLMPADVLILYTDGVTEAQNENDSLHFLVRVALNLFCKPTWADRLP